MAGSLIPDVGNVSTNTTGALNNLMKAYDNFGTALAAPGDYLTKLADKQELRDRLEKEDALKAEALAYSRGRDELQDKRYDENLARVEAEKNDLKQKEANTAALLFANRDKDAFIASKINAEKQAAYDGLNNLTGQEAIDAKNQLDAYFAGQGAKDSGKQWLENAQSATNIDAIKVEQTLFDQKKLQEEMAQRKAESAQRAKEAAAQVAATNRNSNLQEKIYNDKVAELKETKDSENMANKIALGLNPETKYEVKQQREQTEQEKLNSASSYGDKLMEDKDVQKSLSNIEKNNIGINKIDEALSNSTYSKVNEARNKLKDLESLKLTDPYLYRKELEKIVNDSGVLKNKASAGRETDDGSYLYKNNDLEDKILNYSQNSEENKLINNRKLLQQNIDKESSNINEKAANNFNTATSSKVDETVTKTKNLSDDEITRMAKNIALGKDINYSGEYSLEDQEKINKNSGSILKAVTPAIKAVKDQEDKDRDARAKIAEENRKNEQKIREIILENEGAVKVAKIREKNGNKMTFKEYANLDDNKGKSIQQLNLGFDYLVNEGLAVR